MRYYLAIDIGASSGRHILGHLESGRLVLEEVYRFDNLQLRKDGHDCWDLDNLWMEILNGLRICKQIGKIPESMGIDTWAVDFVLMDEKDQLIGDAVAYRDSRTEGMKEVVNRIIPAEQIYERTGIQYQPFNTIYQLMALKQQSPEQLEQARWLLMIPEYFHFKLTGVKQNEYTNASSTNLLNAADKSWDMEIIRQLDLPEGIFHPLAMPGTKLGCFLPEIRDSVGFETTVILPATHDTGSAFLAVPARDENAVYLSSGTWSLLGVENPVPITSLESMRQNFTNEGGAWYRYRYLKNIMGLWIIQSVRRELNGTSHVQGVQGKCKSREGEKQWSFPDLIAEAQQAETFTSCVDVNRECFLAPDSMIEAIREECRRTGQAVPESVGEIMQCVYTSLALCYRDAIESLEILTGKRYTSINIVGGGCQDDYLNSCTAAAVGLPVYAGPVEGTSIGNLIVQMIEAGEMENLQAARNVIRRSFNIKEVKP